MLVAVGTGPVPDRHPGRRLLSFALQAQRLHRLVGDLRPLIITQLTIAGRKRQRQMEYVATLRVRAERLVGRVESRTDVSDLLAREIPARQRIATQLEARGDDPLVGVLVRLAGPEQVADEPTARGATGDLRDHRGSSKLDRSRLCCLRHLGGGSADVVESDREGVGEDTVGVGPFGQLIHIVGDAGQHEPGSVRIPLCSPALCRLAADPAIAASKRNRCTDIPAVVALARSSSCSESDNRTFTTTWRPPVRLGMRDIRFDFGTAAHSWSIGSVISPSAATPRNPRGPSSSDANTTASQTGDLFDHLAVSFMTRRRPSWSRARSDNQRALRALFLPLDFDDSAVNRCYNHDPVDENRSGRDRWDAFGSRENEKCALPPGNVTVRPRRPHGVGSLVGAVRRPLIG